MGSHTFCDRYSVEGPDRQRAFPDGAVAHRASAMTGAIANLTCGSLVD